MPSVAPALAPPSIIPTMLNTYSIRRSGGKKQMHRTCASCRQRQAQPFRVLGRNVPAQPSGSAQRPSPGTASASLLGSVPGSARGTAASGPVPGFILGCRLFRYNSATAPSPLHSHHPAIRCVSCSSRPNGRSSAFSSQIRCRSCSSCSGERYRSPSQTFFTSSIMTWQSLG